MRKSGKNPIPQTLRVDFFSHFREGFSRFGSEDCVNNLISFSEQDGVIVVACCRFD